MRKLASFFCWVKFIVVAFLLLPSFSYAKNQDNNVTVSAMVLETITFKKTGTNLSIESNSPKGVSLDTQDQVNFITIKL